MEIKERIAIEINHTEKGKDDFFSGQQIINVYADDKLVFSQTINQRRGKFPYGTKSGIAGAVMLLHSLIYGNTNQCYYTNDYMPILFEEIDSLKYSIPNINDVCKNLSFFGKLRFKFFYLKRKFFNVFSN